MSTCIHCYEAEAMSNVLYCQACTQQLGKEYMQNFERLQKEAHEQTIYPDIASAQDALDRGEWVCIELDPYPLDPQLVQKALDLQAQERLNQWKRDR